MCKEAKILLLVSTIFTLAMGLSGIFINVFFWRETKNFGVIAIYNLMHYLFAPITFFAAGYLSKKKNGIWSLRIGLVLFALFFGLMLLVGNRGTVYIYMLGVLFGISSGFYWLAYNTLSFDFTSVDNRDTFNGFNGSCAGVAAAIAPISSAFIISRFQGVKGYSIVFTATLSLFVILTLISLMLKCDKYGSKLDFSKSVSKNCTDWSTVRKAIFFWGFRDVIIVFVVNILIITTTGSELSLGKLSLLAALISSGSFVLVQKIIKPAKRVLSIYIGGIFAFAALWGLFIKVNYHTLLLYTIMDAFFIPFYMIQLSSATFNIIDRVHEEDMRIEYMINRELALNLGRIISICILLVLLKVLKSLDYIRFYLLFIGAAPFISALFLGSLKKVLLGDKG